MPSRRPRRFAATVALVAILLSMLPTAGARLLGVTSSFGADSDYCSTVGARGAPPAFPPPVHHDHRLAHCDGCTGNSGTGVALTGGIAPTPACRCVLPAIVELATPVPSPAHLIAAPPRGPPRVA